MHSKLAMLWPTHQSSPSMGWDGTSASPCAVGPPEQELPFSPQPCSPATLQPRSMCQPATKGSLSGGSWRRAGSGAGRRNLQLGKKQIHFQELHWNECQFPKQNCHFSVRMTVASELKGCYFQLKMPLP